MRSCERIESLTGMEELWPRRRRLAGRLAQPRISAARFCFFVFVRQISKATNTSSKLASHVEMIWDTWTPCFCRLDYRKTYTSSPFAHRPLIQSQWRLAIFWLRTVLAYITAISLPCCFFSMRCSFFQFWAKARLTLLWPGSIVLWVWASQPGHCETTSGVSPWPFPI